MDVQRQDPRSNEEVWGPGQTLSQSSRKSGSVRRLGGCLWDQPPHNTDETEATHL